MKKWIVFGGIGIVVGGITSLAMTLGVEGKFDFREDFISYSIGWLIAGIVMIGFGFILKPKNQIQD